MDGNKSSTLLLVSDDLSSKLIIKKSLENAFTLFEAATYTEVVEILSHRQIEFIIIDSNVQEGLGITLCREIRLHKRFSYIPIVLLIDTQDEDLVNEAIDGGVTNILSKPINNESIKTCVLLAKHWSSTLQYMTSFSQGLKKIAEHDALTNLYNRYYLFDVGRKEVAKSSRSNLPISLLMIDIDKFKMINDTYGHLVGDEVLIQLAELIQKNSRTYDIPVRYGGEEFVVLLPGAGIEQALAVGEKIRKNVENNTFISKQGIKIKLTVSVGVATLKPKTSSLEILIEEADIALYDSKQKGRNCVSLK
jgi:two-component system cell cycle response regulator